mgnify:CR=1 FL=1
MRREWPKRGQGPGKHQHVWTGLGHGRTTGGEAMRGCEKCMKHRVRCQDGFEVAMAGNP